MSKIGLLNTSILTNFGSYDFKPCTVTEAKELINTNGFVSHIGHEATASLLSIMLGVNVVMSRNPYCQEVGETAIVLKIKGRIPEGKIITDIVELNTIGYDLGFLTRLN